MGRLRESWRRLRSLPRRDALERGLEQEIQFHIEAQTEKNRRAGMSPDEARRQALVRFGGVESAKEGTRDQFRAAVLEDLVRDVRYGARALRRAPGFSIVAILTLGLGIGATTAMFSVVNGVLLRPLPYPEQDRLIDVSHEAPGLGIVRLAASPAIYFTYRDHSRTFEAVGLWDWDKSPVTVTGAGDPEAVTSLEVTREVLPLLRADPIVGRGFNEADDRPGGAPTVIVSDGYRRRRFGNEDPLGRTLVVNGVARQVIGVLPPSFRFFKYDADLFYPLQPDRSDASFPSFDGRAVARLKKGVTLQEANADVARMIPILNAEFGSPGAWKDARFGPNLRWLKDSVVGNLGDTLWLLMGTIGLLLAMACANVANLVLVRAQVRRPVLAVRAALGAGWADLARVVFAENAILGLAGGLAGLAVAYVSLPFLLSLGAADLPEIMTVKIDSTVLLVTLGASVLATVVFALIPVLHLAASGVRLTGMLQGSGRSATEGPQGNRVRDLLVVSQVALALILLIGSGLMIRTSQQLRRVDPGFREAAHVQTFQLTLPAAETPDAARAGTPSREQSLQVRRAILEGLAAMGGVQSAGFSSFDDGLPLDGDGRSATILVEGRTSEGGVLTPREIQFVSPGFFETLQTPVRAGRTFDWSDVLEGRRVVVVSENYARAEWGSAGAAIGKRVATRREGPWSEVVGVVQDVHHWGLSVPAPPTIIFPAALSPSSTFVVRSERAGTTGFLDDVRRAVRSVNGDLSLARVRTLGELYQRSMARTSMTLHLFAITGTMALVLGLIGIYGVVSYAVSQRRREIGIRLALGAARGEVRRMFVRHALALVGIGVVIGLSAAAGLTRLMASQLFGVSPLDPLTHVAVALLLVTAAALASDVSARNGSALDPVEVLKGN